MANSWVDVTGLTSARWPSMPTNMVNYTLNGSGTDNNQFSGVNYTAIDDGTYHTAYEQNGLKIEIKLTNTGSTHSIWRKITLNGTVINEDGNGGGSGYTYHPEIGIGFIWDENYNAKIVIMYHITWSTNGNWGWSGCCTQDGHNYAHDLYNWIVNNPYVPTKKSGGAGSGYIGNSLVSNKKMVGYNVPTSDAINTKTESVQVYSPAPLANMPKMGDGFARIKFLREYDPVPPEYQQYIDIINPTSMPTWYSNVIDPIFGTKSLMACRISDQGRTVYLDILDDYDSSMASVIAYDDGIARLDILSTSNENEYSFTCPSVFTDYTGFYFSSSPSTRYTSLYIPLSSGGSTGSLEFNGSFSSHDKTGTLTEVLTWIGKFFRNVDLYVDGVCWSKKSN